MSTKKMKNMTPSSFSFYDSQLDIQTTTLESYRGCFVRPGTSDKEMVRDCQKNYRVFLDELRDEDRVLDLGANIGAFSALTAARNIYTVAVEADSFNCAVARENIPDTLLLEGAIVSGAYEGEEALFETIRSGKNACSGRVAGEKKRKDRLYRSVPIFRLNEVIYEHQITAIKFDIEGGEFEVFREPIPEQVTLITGEIHMFKKAQRLAGPELIGKFFDQDFEIIHREDEVVFGDVSLINFTMSRR